MVPWNELGRARLPDGELVLARRGDEYVLRMRGAELMNSRSHASEEALATFGCAGLAATRRAKVLIGGLGMGFTARAALDALAPDAQVVVAELVPEVVAWNRGPLADLARRPLDDPRVEVRIGDVANAIGAGGYHAILLDVDNGPDAFTAPGNARLYGLRGLIRARHALVAGGRLAVWSVAGARAFTDRLRGAGFAVEIQKVGPRKHVVWVATSKA